MTEDGGRKTDFFNTEVAEQHWVWGAVGRSAVPFVVGALVFSLAGATIQHIKPGATSIDGVFHAERGELRD